MTNDPAAGRYVFTAAVPGWWAWFAERDPEFTGGVWRDPIAGWMTDSVSGIVQPVWVGSDGIPDIPQDCGNFLVLSGPGMTDVGPLLCTALAVKMGAAWSDDVEARALREVRDIAEAHR